MTAAMTSSADEMASSPEGTSPLEQNPGHDALPLRPQAVRGPGIAEGLATGAVLVVCIMARLPRRLLDVTGVHEWALAVVVVVATVSVARGAVRAPFSFARCRINSRAGAVPAWAAEQFKVLVATIVVGAGLTVPLYGLFRVTPAWWLLAWVMFGIVTLAGQAAMPWVLRAQAGPLTLAGPVLATRIQAVGTAAGVDIGAVIVAGKAGAHGCNAYVVGLGPTRRIVLETGLGAWPPDLVDQVVAHEIGHWRLGHTARRLPLTLAVQLVTLAMAARVLSAAPVLAMAGVSHIGDPRSYPLLLCLTVLLAFPARSVLAWRDRAQERAADQFALTLLAAPDRFAAMLQRAAVEGGAPWRLAWWRRLTASHPPISERTVACASFAPTY